jgi:putative transposase
LTDGAGVPLAVTVAGANRHDMKLVEPTLEAIEMESKDCEEKPNLCLDKGYDYPEVRELVEAYGYYAHIRSRGEEKREAIAGYRARRWVVERAHSWMNRFRRLLIRWEKKEDNFLNMIYLACAYVTFHFAGVFG